MAHVEEPRITISITGIDPLGGFTASREVWPHLGGDELHQALVDAAGSCIEHAVALHGMHTEQETRPGVRFLYGKTGSA